MSLTDDLPDADLPVLSAGTSREDSDGATSSRQREVLALLAGHKGYGVTVKDVRHALALHHGQASSALSNLHKAGRITRLTERRDRCSIYVLPQYVKGRETAAQGHKVNWKQKAEELEAALTELQTTPAAETYDASLLRAQWRTRALRAEAALRAARSTAEPLAVTMTHGQLIAAYTRLRSLLNESVRSSDASE